MSKRLEIIDKQTALYVLNEAALKGVSVEEFLQEVISDEMPNSSSRPFKSAQMTVNDEARSRWLVENAAQYVGKWIVLDGAELIGFGDNPLPLFRRARQKGVKVPFVKFISETDEPFSGVWL